MNFLPSFEYTWRIKLSALFAHSSTRLLYGDWDEKFGWLHAVSGFDYGQTLLFYRKIHTLPWLSNPFNLYERFFDVFTLVFIDKGRFYHNPHLITRNLVLINI